MFTGTMLRHKSCLLRHNEEQKEDSLLQHKKKKTQSRQNMAKSWKINVAIGIFMSQQTIRRLTLQVMEIMSW